MKEFDALRLDVEALTAAGASLAGEWPAAGFARWAEGGTAESPPVRWSAVGEQRAAAGGPELWLHLRAQGATLRQCQRCLQPVMLPIEVDRRLRFVRDEAEAARLDEDSEDDVLVLPRRLDLHELVEDELILALPLVPRHESCPVPLWTPSADHAADAAAPDADAAPHPFAALAAWRRTDTPPGGGNGGGTDGGGKPEGEG